MMVVMGAGASVISIATMQQLRQILYDVVDLSEPLSVAAFEMEINTIGAGMGVVNYLHDPDPAYVERFRKEQADFAKYHKRFVELLENTDHAALGEKLGAFSARYSALAESLLEAKDREVAVLDRLVRDLADLHRDLIDDDGIAAEFTGSQSQPFVALQHELLGTIGAMSIAFAKPIGPGHEGAVVISHGTVQGMRNKLNELVDLGQRQDPRGRIGQFLSNFDAALNLFTEFQGLRQSIRRDLSDFNSLEVLLDDILDEEIQIFTRNRVLEDRGQFLGSIQATELELGLLALTGLIFAGIAVGLIYRRIIHPVQALVVGTKALGKGDLTHRIELRNEDEFGELSDAFNDMADQLADAKVGLESLVRDRTVELKTANGNLKRELARRRSLEEQLVHAQKLEALGTLAGGVAHDFNNMLYVIIGCTEIVLDDLPSDSRARESLSNVLAAAERSRDIVSQVLSFSRQDKPHRIALPFDRVVQASLKLLRAMLPSTHSLKVDVQEHSGLVLADETQLEQVIVNLVTNAFQAGAGGKGSSTVTVDRVEVDTALAELHVGLEPGPYVRLTVADDGRGIPPDQQSRIFDPFFTTKPVGEGTGLGLSVVHGIVLAHKGAISVSSEVGRGTTIVVYLPLYMEYPLAQEDSAAQAAGTISSSRSQSTARDGQITVAAK